MIVKPYKGELDRKAAKCELYTPKPSLIDRLFTLIGNLFNG